MEGLKMLRSLKDYMYILFQILPLLLVGANMYIAPKANINTLQYNLVDGRPNIYIVPMAEKIGHTWFNGSVWDKPLIQKFYRLLMDHDDFFVAIDLGAQTGSFSLLAKYFPNSMWYAFEPIYEAANILKENLLCNDIHNVFVFPIAVSDFSGKTTLKMPTMDAWGLSTIGSNVLRFTPVMEREIQCIDLDSFIPMQHIKKVHFMKLDTEGSELYILRGAQKIIMRDHPIILMEYCETNMKQCGVLRQDIDSFLRSMGYEWKLVSNEDILCIQKFYI